MHYTYITMLRGINVSGQKKIKMADLRAHLQELGLKSIQTYIQSGNIICQYASTDLTELEGIIGHMIQEKYGFDVPVMVRRPEAFQYVVENNPFLKEPEKSTDRQYITFLSDQPEPEKVEALKELNYEPEEFFIDDRIIFFYAPKGYGRAKMNNNFFEKKLNVQATTRNWKTVNKLLEMSNLFRNK